MRAHLIALCGALLWGCATGAPRADVSHHSALAARCDAAQDADGAACRELGRLYRRGEGGVARDEAAAARRFERGCALNDKESCSIWAYLLMVGEGVREDLPAAMGIYQRLCEEGDGAACNNLGALYAGDEDFERGLSYFSKACERGWGMGCTNAGYLHIRGQLRVSDDAAARVLFERGCKGGNDEGCIEFAGMILEQDPGRSFEIFKQLCDKKKPEGCLNVGVMYYRGVFVQKDIKTASSFYERACELGLGMGCANAMEIEIQARARGEQDSKRLLRLAERGCGLKCSDCCFIAGVSHAIGEGCAVNTKNAVGFFAQGCDLDHAKSCMNLGLYYGKGESVKKNVSEALSLLAKSCELGEDAACKILEDFNAQFGEVDE